MLACCCSTAAVVGCSLWGLALLLGCGEDHGSDVGASATAQGGIASSEVAAACPDHQVDCDGSCIDEIPPTADAIQARVFERSCAFNACHGEQSAMEGLALGSVDDMFASAVGKPSQQAPSLALIQPGQPSASYLIRKLRNRDIAARASDGGPSTAMPPPPNPVLCGAKVDIIEAWIAQGAPR